MRSLKEYDRKTAMNYGLIGEHLPHSFSKDIHEMIGGYDYILHEVAKDKLDDFMTARDFKGINVTIPYKQDVIPYLTGISDRAEKIGAVNTIVNKEGKLYGDNTDFGGLKALVKRTGIDMNGKKVIILGTGGTSKTAYAVADSLGAAEICKASRTAKNNALYYEEIYQKHADADVIINTTPCGMFPNVDSVAIDIDRFTKLTGVLDVVYNPLRTKLVAKAQKKGIKSACGLYMLVSQAIIASEVFMEKKHTENLTDAIYRKIYKEKENIVLTGMPRSGKTTLGKILAKSLSRPLIDTDDMIIKKTGKTPSEIFAEEGEKYFRDVESEVVREISVKTGLVISTGGVAILRNENVDALKMNGKLFFLDRPLDALLPTKDRPLANSKEKIIALYKTRRPIYLAAADEIIKVEGTPRHTAEFILKEYR